MQFPNWLYNLLRRTQKYTGTDNVYLVKGGFWLSLGQIIENITSFFLAVAFANLLDPATYGNYQYILSLAGTLGICSLLSMGTAVIQATARGLEGSFYTAFMARLKWSSIGSLIALGLAIYFWSQGNATLPIPLLIVAAFLPLLNAANVYNAFLSGKKLFDVGTKYSIGNKIIPTLAMIIAIFLTKNLFLIVAVYFISNTLANYLFYWLTKSKFQPNTKEDPQTLTYGKHLSFAGIVSVIADYLDKILLFQFIGPVQLAVYSFAILLPDHIRSVVGNIPILALPKLASRSEEEIKKTIMKKFWKLSLLVVVITILYIALSPIFYKIFFSKYLDSLPYTQVFALSLLFIPASLLGTVFEAKMKTKKIYLLKFFSLFRIILFLILIPLYGIWGLIAARLGMQVLNLALTLFLLKRL